MLPSPKFPAARSVLGRRGGRVVVAIAAAAYGATVPAFADEGKAARAAESGRYEACLDAAQIDPTAARERAAQWEAAGGGAYARHCAAIALIGLGAGREAAKILTDIGSGPSSTLTAGDRAGMLRLAGDLWLRLGQHNLARRCFETALSLTAGDRDSLIGAARAAAAEGAYGDAEVHLSTALDGDGADPEALTLRAAARRALGRPSDALADAEAATQVAPGSALAWFERGAAERKIGRDAAARESWLRASELDFSGPAGDMARLGLQRMAHGG